MEKKSQIQSELLRYILITVVAFLIIVFSIMLMRNLRERQREADLIGFKEDVSSSIEVIAARVGSVDREVFTLPEDIDLVCFLDLDKRDKILETPLVDKYVFIKDSLESESEQNVFLIANDILSDVFYEEDVCFENYPYYQCVEATYGTLDMLLEGLGSCATIHTNYSAFISDNKRNTSKYERIELGGFLAEDTDNPTNYRDILQIIPLAFVNSKDSYRQYPYVVYHGDIDDNKIRDLMDEKGINTTIIFRGADPGEYTLEEGGKYYTIIDENLDKDNYLSYWSTIYDVTLIGYNNQDGALIAGLFAAFTNTPLIFIDSSNLDDYKELLSGKNINVIDENSIDAQVIEYIEDLPYTEVRYFDSSDLRILSQNRILELESGIIID